MHSTGCGTLRACSRAHSPSVHVQLLLLVSAVYPVFSCVQSSSTARLTEPTVLLTAFCAADLASAKLAEASPSPSKCRRVMHRHKEENRQTGKHTRGQRPAAYSIWRHAQAQPIRCTPQSVLRINLLPHMLQHAPMQPCTITTSPPAALHALRLPTAPHTTPCAT